MYIPFTHTTYTAYENEIQNTYVAYKLHIQFTYLVQERTFGPTDYWTVGSEGSNLWRFKP
jgi:hypothetical protein